MAGPGILDRAPKTDRHWTDCACGSVGIDCKEDIYAQEDEGLEKVGFCVVLWSVFSLVCVVYL